MAGRLYVVGTPIGNLGDITERAIATLRSVDLVAAEDTRRTGRLLLHLGIKKTMRSLFEGNERERTQELLAALREGREVALVSDAGMPSVSDPGHLLVRACVEEGIDVRVVPGPSAVTAALVVSGLPSERFVFEGFLPRKVAVRRERLRALAGDPRTVVLFESPLRLSTLLADVVAELGDRRIAVCRELTKLHEEVFGSRLGILALLEAKTRGEIVVVIEGRARPGRPDGPWTRLFSWRRMRAGPRRPSPATGVGGRSAGPPRRRDRRIARAVATT
jgi:16S rRNA (cytidine1402-2'-O)-methyltransferase